MNIEFQSLEGVPHSALTVAFNAAFADHPIPFRLEEAQLATMWQRRGFDPALSVGAFHQNELVGFHIICRGDWQGSPSVYDTGTGVLPSARGLHLSARMFDWVMPRWLDAGFHQCILEVLSNNERAYRSYTSVGFELQRELTCYQLEVLPALTIPAGVSLDLVPKNEVPDEVLSWLDEPLPWQNSLQSIKRTPQHCLSVRLLVQGRLAAFGMLMPENGDVPLFAVAPRMRRHGLGAVLLASLRGASKAPLRLLTLTPDSPSIALIRAVGGTHLVDMREMRWQF